VNAGLAALAAALVLGRRLGYPDRLSPPHNLPLASLGAGILWFGWFGFNAGSALGAGGLATSAFVVTHTAAATAGLTWAVLDSVFARKPTMLGMITGVVAGLVAITPASGFVTVPGALAVGVGAAALPYLAVAFLKTRLGYDDSLDAFGVHGVGGVWGALATGLFATAAVNPAGADGLLYGGGARLLGLQAAATAVTAVYSFVASGALLFVVDRTVGLRVGEHDERVGLDLTQHREAAYTMLE
jgi:Amt family ammonium transporter